MKKYLLFAIALFSLFVASPKAALYSGEPIALDLGGYMIPEYFGVAANSETKYAMTLYVEDYSSYNGSRFALVTVCTPYDIDNWYVTNSGKVNSYFDEFFDTFDTGKRCYMGDNVRGTLRFLQFYIGKPKTIDGTSEIRVSSYLHLKNIYNYNVRYDFLQVQLSDEDYLAPLINQSVSSQKQQEIVDKLTQNIQSINDLKNKQDQTNSKLDDLKSSQDKTNDTLTSEDEDTTSKKCGVVCKLKGIFTGIIELPKKIVTLIIDALKKLFVPTDDQLYEIVNDSKELSENFGFVGEAVAFFLNIFTGLLGMVNANGCIEMPAFKIGATSLFDEHTFWEARNVCLADNTILSANIDTIRTITSIAFVSLFLGFAASKFFGILSKNDSGTSITYDENDNSFTVNDWSRTNGITYNRRYKS